MDIRTRTLTTLYAGLLGLACASSVIAADPVTPQPHLWPWWPQMQWPAFGWIFALVCFVMMVIMFLFMTREGAWVACGAAGLRRTSPASAIP